MSRALDDIAAERRRQIEVEGWTPEHDDEHRDGSLAEAAAAYAYAASAPGRDHGRLWPWAANWWKPGSPRRMLVKAGALIVAAIERIDRICPDCHGTGFTDWAHLAIEPCSCRSATPPREDPLTTGLPHANCARSPTSRVAWRCDHGHQAFCPKFTDRVPV